MVELILSPGHRVLKASKQTRHAKF